MGLLSSVFKQPNIENRPLPFNLKHSCNDDCKWKCDVGNTKDIFCHLIGEDLSQDQYTILQKVGCFMWRRKEIKKDKEII